ncbi:TorF family putative porin [Hyphomicrobium sp. CS1GBMeth3]|uniref:TorF family putative porin n=1 Tax=Hyphomicrobium sp. CS1GBMeth3 TaxID=1892845 RepID=UPI0009301740|nr:TorF family putative porin [Hyphomicrobium sp. CS1GBMeth3]
MTARTFMKSVGVASAALVALSVPGFASDITPPPEGRKFEWNVTGTVTSDYVFRGVSLSDEEPAFQAAIDASYGIFYAGVWGSSLEGEGFEPVELDFYAGIKPALGPVTFDFGVVYYTYFWGSPSDTNYVELKAGAEFSPITNLTLAPVFWYTPDQDNYAETYTIEGTASYEFAAIRGWTPTISGLVGYTESSDDGFFFDEDDYTYWNVGLSLAYDKFTFDFRYWDTNLSDVDEADERFVFTASVSLY